MYKNNNWVPAAYDGYFELELMKYDFYFKDEEFIMNPSVVKTHKCADKDRENFYPRSDYAQDLFNYYEEGLYLNNCVDEISELEFYGHLMST